MVAFIEREDAVKARSFLLHLGIVLLLLAPLVLLNGCRRPAVHVPKHGTAWDRQDGTQEVDPLLALPSDELPKGAKLRLGTLHGAAPSTVQFLWFTLEGKGYLVLGHLLGGVPHIWDLTTGKASHLPRVERPTEGNPGIFEEVIFALSADGKRGVLGQHGTYAVWELATGKVIARIKPPVSLGLYHQDIGYPLSLSADGTILAFADRGNGPDASRQIEVLVWDVDRNEQLVRVNTIQKGYVFPVLSPDGKRLATHGFHPPERPRPADEPDPGEAFQLWEVPGGKLLGTVPKVLVNSLADEVRFSPDGKLLATRNTHGSIRLWDVATCKTKDPQPQLSGDGIAFSPDGKTLAAIGRGGIVQRWSVADGRALKDTPIPKDLSDAYWQLFRVRGLRFADNERVLAWGAFGLRAVAWEATSGTLLTPHSEHYAEIRGVQFTANGREVITNGVDNRIVRWDATTGTSNGSLTPPVHIISPDATRGIIDDVLIDLTTGKELHKLPIRPMGVSPDFTLVAGCRIAHEREKPGLACEIFNLKTQRQVAVLDLPSKEVELWPLGGSAMVFSPDGSRLVTAIRLRGTESALVAPLLVTGWDVKTGKKLGEFTEQSGTGVVYLAVANNTSCVIATEGFRELPKLWAVDYENGRKGDLIDQCKGLRPLHAPVFSPDGKRLAWPMQLGWDRGFGVRVYDWPSGQVVHTFEGHRAPVNVIAFSPDGKTLASGSQDTTVLLWDLTTLPAPK
jgi:WD40 repeat protein